MLRTKQGKLLNVHVDNATGSMTMVFAPGQVELHPGHFLKGNAGGFSITIFNNDRAVLTEDATPEDIAAAAQATVRGSR